MLPDSLEARINKASSTGSDLVYSDEITIFDWGKHPRYRHSQEYSSTQELFESLLRHESGVSYLTLFWQADFYLNKVGSFDERLTSAEDWDIAMASATALMESSASCTLLKQATMVRRIHENCLRWDNMRSGTTEKCYSIILGKYLQGEALQQAMQREYAGNLRPPALHKKIRQRVSDLLPPKILNKVYQLKRQFRRKPEALPADVEAFLRQIPLVD